LQIEAYFLQIEAYLSHIEAYFSQIEAYFSQIENFEWNDVALLLLLHTHPDIEYSNVTAELPVTIS